jgi:hypothetical protein
MNRFQKSVIACVGTLLTFTTIPFSQAAFHLFQIGEVYSNASGTVQFVELFTDQTGQNLLHFTSFTSTSHTFPFPTDLSSTATNNKHFILATPGYAALSGVPAPDYTLPVNNFFSTTGDTLTLQGGMEGPSLTFTAGQLPTDGLHSLNRAYLGAFTPPPTTFTTAVNSPTNFLGTTSSVVKPGDLNLDLHVNAGDVPAMENALIDPAGYAASKGMTTTELASIGNVNQDSSFNNGDLQALLDKLKTGGGTSSTVPEPNACFLAALVGGLLWKSRRQFKIDC